MTTTMTRVYGDYMSGIRLPEIHQAHVCKVGVGG